MDKKTALQKLSDKILEWDAQLDGLKEITSGATAELKKEYETMIKELKAQKKEAETTYEKIKTSSDEGWDELKIGAEKAFNELSNAFAKAKEKFKK